MTAGVCEFESEDSKLFSGDSSSDFLGEVTGDGKGFRNGSGLGTNCIVLGSVTVKEGDVQVVDEKACIEKGSTVDSYDSYVNVKIDIISEESVKIHLDVSDGAVEQVSTCEVEKVNETENMVVETTDMIPDMIPTVSSEATDATLPPLMEDSKSGFTDISVENKDVEATVEGLLDLADLEETQESSMEETQDSSLEDGEPKLSDLAGENVNYEEQGKDDSEIIDAKYVEVDVEIVNKENVGEPQLSDLAGEDVNSEEQGKDDSEIIDTKSVELAGEDVNSEEKGSVEVDVEVLIVNKENVGEPQMSDLASEDVNSEEQGKDDSEIIDTESVEVDVKENFEIIEEALKEDPIVIFPATFVSPKINIQFGSFCLDEKDDNTHPGDLSAVPEILNGETDYTCGVNSSDPVIIPDDLQGIRSVEKVTHEEVKDDVVSMPSMEVSSEFMGTQIEDSGSKVHEVEDMIEHETMCLKDENQLIPDELVSSVGSKDEVQEVVNQKDEIEELMENSRMESSFIKENVSKVEVDALAISETHEEEKEKGKEVEAKFQAADITKQISMVSIVEQGKRRSENKHTEFQTMKKVVGKVRHSMKTKEPVKFLIKDSAFACLNEIMEDEVNEETMKAVESRKAEQKEKAREKRLKKKERKRTGGKNMSSSMKDENSEKLKEANETETTIQKPQGPPAVALAAGGRKRTCHQLGKMGMAAVIFYILFFLSNIITVNDGLQ